MPHGWLNEAEVTGPPSPLVALIPVPPFVRMIPVEINTFLTRLLMTSANNKLPDVPNATLLGLPSIAAVAAPPPQKKPEEVPPTPATSEKMPVGDTFQPLLAV